MKNQTGKSRDFSKYPGIYPGPKLNRDPGIPGIEPYLQYVNLQEKLNPNKLQTNLFAPNEVQSNLFAPKEVECNLFAVVPCCLFGGVMFV